MSASLGLLVLGGHRCGTSLAAGLLALHGAFMGRTLPPGRHNPKGYWEHMGVNEANENLLARLRVSWDWPFALPECGEEVPASVRTLMEQAIAPFSGRTFWALKDPRLCRLLPFWRPLLARLGTVRGIVIFRHPEGSCRSLEKRNGFGRGRALSLWLHHFADAVHHLGDTPWIALEYERLLADPEESMARLASEFELRWPRVPGREELRAFADRSLQHHRPAPAPENGPRGGDPLEERCLALHEALSRMHLSRPDAELRKVAAALRKEADANGGLSLELALEMHEELLRLRAWKTAAELEERASARRV
jgi:hypothetical protein